MAETPSLALRYIVCDACETVFAQPDETDEPAACGRCGARRVRELRSVRGPDAYFSP
ncbi:MULTISPECIES: hypothetical protein [Halorubrum]|uniref:Regulatory protein, FmdB family n=1 Tax=Halorubrum sodomense TaxID=35743 RepID=A0A1I6FZ95_HALSD|nr:MULTISPECIES: hypothetical protein [Halorubrum]SFR35252.1 hypothetical protein SAMN04487937_1414 [Halorubrum sodomense]